MWSDLFSSVGYIFILRFHITILMFFYPNVGVVYVTLWLLLVCKLTLKWRVRYTLDGELENNRVGTSKDFLCKLPKDSRIFNSRDKHSKLYLSQCEICDLFALWKVFMFFKVTGVLAESKLQKWADSSNK